MVSLITNHVIMWKPQHPQRINESLLDKMNDSLWTGYWWWLSTGEMGGQICMWVCIYLEEMSEFCDYAEVSNWIWKMHRKCRITLDCYLIAGEIIGNAIRQFNEIVTHSGIWTLCSPNQMQQPGQYHTLPRRMIQPSGILERGSCYICSAAVNCGLEKCITLGALNALVMS